MCCRPPGSETHGPGDRRSETGHGGDRRHVGRDRAPVARPARAARGPGLAGALPTAVFCENETNLKRLYGVAPTTPYPKDGINDHVVNGADTVYPGAQGDEVRLLVPGHRPAGRDGGAAAPAAASEDDDERVLGRRVRRRVRPGYGAAEGRGGSVLRRADAGGRDRRRGDGDAPGVRRAAVEQAAVPLRRDPLAGRRPDQPRRRLSG